MDILLIYDIKGCPKRQPLIFMVAMKYTRYLPSFTYVVCCRLVYCKGFGF